MRTRITTLLILFMTYIVMITSESKIRQNMRIKRTWIIDSFAIEEENPGPFPYILGKIKLEKGSLLKYFLKGTGIDEEPEDVLSINVRTGELFVHQKVDYEKYQRLLFTFEAREESSNLHTKLGVEVMILDINDHAPAFSALDYETTIDESVPEGTLVTMVSALDKDNPNTPNGTFTFSLRSVIPKTDNVEFYIITKNTTCSIYFRGCLDYEKAQKYTIVIEAKDNGDKVQLSNTTTVVLNINDKNNHLPEITGHTGPGKIKERESGVEVLRLQVSDKDSQGSGAWRAKFTLQGDPENYFKIHTDPITNEGVLTVMKPMDYEDQTSRNVSVTVENEEPYFFCKVKTQFGFWELNPHPKESGSRPSNPYLVTITVEDVNDPPEFVPPVQEMIIIENTKIGTLLDILKVIDPDKPFENAFHFVKGKDENNWVNVDSETGQVSVAKVLDRESPLLNVSTYSVIVYAVNKAQPSQTGSGTLVVCLRDENDNVPQLVMNTMSMCLSEEKTSTEISAVDLDLPPYSAPFQYELLEDEQMEGKWKIEPNHGTTVKLIKMNSVYTGHYTIRIKISDSQGYGSVQSISITVCDCTVKSSCGVRTFTAHPNIIAIGTMMFAFLLLLAIPVMALQCNKNQKIMIMYTEFPGTLLPSNTEALGTDCKVPFDMPQLISWRTVKMYSGFSKEHSELQSKNSISKITSTEYYSMNCLANHIDQMLQSLQSPEQELGDYEPHIYAYEGEPDENLDKYLETLSIPETEFHPDILDNLDSHFLNLAAVCRPN